MELDADIMARLQGMDDLGNILDDVEQRYADPSYKAAVLCFSVYYGYLHEGIAQPHLYETPYSEYNPLITAISLGNLNAFEILLNYRHPNESGYGAIVDMKISTTTKRSALDYIMLHEHASALKMSLKLYPMEKAALLELNAKYHGPFPYLSQEVQVDAKLKGESDKAFAYSCSADGTITWIQHRSALYFWQHLQDDLLLDHCKHDPATPPACEICNGTNTTMTTEQQSRVRASLKNSNQTEVDLELHRAVTLDICANIIRSNTEYYNQCFFSMWVGDITKKLTSIFASSQHATSLPESVYSSVVSLNQCLQVVEQQGKCFQQPSDRHLVEDRLAVFKSAPSHRYGIYCAIHECTRILLAYEGDLMSDYQKRYVLSELVPEESERDTLHLITHSAVSMLEHSDYEYWKSRVEKRHRWLREEQEKQNPNKEEIAACQSYTQTSGIYDDEQVRSLKDLCRLAFHMNFSKAEYRNSEEVGIVKRGVNRVAYIRQQDIPEDVKNFLTFGVNLL